MFTIKYDEKTAPPVEAAVARVVALDQPDGPATSKVQCNWFKTKNTQDHHTNEYKNDVLVLRRGQAFDLEMTFQGVDFSEIKKTALVFGIDSKLDGVKSIQTKCPVVDTIDASLWCMKIAESNSSTSRLLVKVNIPANAFVGKYLVEIHGPKSNGSLTSSKLIVLFNPWSKEDEVYLDNEEKRNEYVLNETGAIYQGSAFYGPYGIFSKTWNYGQFEKNILDCVFLLLDKDKRSQKNPLKSLAMRSSALWIARVLSAVVNSNDEGGVIAGKWSTPYDGGVSPLSWNGSVAILQQYYKTNKPVKYGQCWVYAGVLTTALRTLGIPARSITNFVSAHDTNQSMTIDNFYDDKGNLIRYLSRDSVWNFHAWNEMWCVRKDLPDKKYDGWQVIDATPQELSFGLWQLGPSPVKAIKAGEIYAGVDTGMVFAEVNADLVDWTLSRKAGSVVLYQKPTYRNTSHVGKFISTKMVGRNEREDITHEYKYPEGSKEERKAFETAYSFGAGALKWTGHFNFEQEGKDLTIDIKGEPAGLIKNGTSFKAVTNVKNTSSKGITVEVSAVLNSIIYTTEIKQLIKRKKFENVAIKAGETVRLELPVDALDYMNKLTEYNTIRMTVVARVLETSKLYVDLFDFKLDNKDRVKLELAQTTLKVKQPVDVKVTFDNSLPITLSNLVFTIEGAGLTEPTSKQHEKLASGEKITKTFTITPYKTGQRTLIVDVDSKEIKDFKDSLNVSVYP